MRRGIAYLLNQGTDVDTRRQLMGHKTHSQAFSAYQSKTAQVDTQAILRNLSSIDVTKFSSVLLGSLPGLPMHLSTAGLQMVARSPSMSEAQERQATALKAHS